MLVLLLGLFAVLFGLLLWGRYRYDLVAFGTLCVALVFGVVPKEEAFSGFAHEATVIVAFVLIISKGLVRSGAVDVLTQIFARSDRPINKHIGFMGGIAALLSAFMNNVAALAILMPVDVQAARQAGRSVGKTLMPLSFATLLGGLVTLIGTPPNIIISSARERALGTPFQMFDFAPVGAACAVIGILFIATVGWRFLPNHNNDSGQVNGEDKMPGEVSDVSDYIAEMVIGDDATILGDTGYIFQEKLGEDGAVYLGMISKSGQMIADIYNTSFQAGDVLVLEGSPEELNRMRIDFGLEFTGEKRHNILDGGALSVSEVVVTRESRLVGRAAVAVRLLRRQGVSVAGVSRQGRPFMRGVGRVPLQAGDVLMLVGAQARLNDAIDWLDCLPLARRNITIPDRRNIMVAIATFAGAIIAASFGLVPLVVALGCVVALYAITEVMPLRELYRSVEWPVVVLLGSLIPLAGALDRTGGTELVSRAILHITQDMSPVFVLIALMIPVMIMADIMNTVATAVIAAPIALDIAKRLDVSADPFLMAVAVASSCAMMTPIGHKNNTIIMGPGGYRFGDYWRLGLPLEILIVAVAVPMILIVWPF